MASLGSSIDSPVVTHPHRPLPTYRPTLWEHLPYPPPHPPRPPAPPPELWSPTRTFTDSHWFMEHWIDPWSVERGFNAAVSLPRHSVTALQLRIVAASQRHSVAASQRRSVTASQRHSVAASQRHSVTASQRHCVKIGSAIQLRIHTSSTISSRPNRLMFENKER